MTLSAQDLLALCELASKAATEAGELIRSYVGKSFSVDRKVGGDTLASQVVTEVDLKSDAIIRRHLLPTLQEYDLALLSEEQEDDGSRLTKDYFWCVDPLDGTLAFAEGQIGYAVSIALLSRAGEPVIGVVYEPLSATLFSAVKGFGVAKNKVPLEREHTPRNSVFTLPIDRSLSKREGYSSFIDALELWCSKNGYSKLELIPNGGAVMNACQILTNMSGAYFKLPKPQQGGGSFWDFGATACMFNEMGYVASDYFGKPLNLNRKDTTFMNEFGVMFASDSNMAESIREIINQTMNIQMLA